ncbi:5'-methylthioadenosine/S-adenosylhomocysteine nucleosidase family protein [Aspergillus brunneoviolaceus CBS 621.78]|uniref:Purine and uridine phosphorylase n=1 Tax=Aspergillus brunneoviolaceus CBS 621.78 TaxID=1450534 RepID=A0ACD1GPG7_9EURO|nr:purine and uridine phosphorylase [Aspergillus brunneoviolaceus CBS 621.78]RAH51146.1 purine and uridine phosphorylase [Aspergillus brunneoviolaceus CBS 621.78]
MQQTHPEPSDSDSSEESPLASISPEEITVAIFCALPLESVAVRYALDEEFHCRPRYNPQTKYIFSYGRIGEHKVVLARPHQIGPVKAALCAAAVGQLFPSVRFALMVGIGAGIPGQRDIRLGDVAVGVPRENHPGVVEYDLGEEAGGAFASKGVSNKPHPLLVSADGCLEEEEIMGRSSLRRILRSITRMPGYGHPDAAASDVLYDPTFHHVNKGADCRGCEGSSERKVVARGVRATKPEYPVVHRGLILSGGGVVKSPEHRDLLRRGYDDAICYEMEAAGIVDEIPCLVIRGICDYADTHKQDGWHRYAAAVAAAYCKAVLCKIDGPDEPAAATEQRTSDAIGECEFAMSRHQPQSGNLPWSDAAAAIPRRLLPTSDITSSSLCQDTTGSRGPVHWYNDSVDHIE